MGHGEEIAKAGLEIKAIKLNPEKPFTWASGYRMPIYNDNRMFLLYPEYRKMICSALSERLWSFDIPDDVIIAGTSTAGISPATTLADRQYLSLIYVRDKPKDHGLRNQIEGIDAECGLNGISAVLIEDLISTGGSSVKAVQAIRDAGGKCDHCISIFSYGLDEAMEMFEGKRAYDGKNKLSSPCKVSSAVTYPVLLEVAKSTRYIDSAKIKMLEEWRADPFGWGEKRGFPRVIHKK